MSWTPDTGMSVASACMVRAVFSALALLVMSCLVTESISPPEEGEFVPSISSPPDAREQGIALDQIVTVDRSELDVGAEFEFRAIVRDENVDETLNYRIFINHRPELGLPTDGLLLQTTLAPAMQSAERSLSFSVPVQLLGNPGECTKVELLVMGEVNPVEPTRTPLREGDIAQAVWWLRVVDDTIDTVDLGSCP